MAPAPWEAVSPREQLFVLITGANRYDCALQADMTAEPGLESTLGDIPFLFV